MKKIFVSIMLLLSFLTLALALPEDARHIKKFRADCYDECYRKRMSPECRNIHPMFRDFAKNAKIKERSAKAKEKFQRLYIELEKYCPITMLEIPFDL